MMFAESILNNQTYLKVSILLNYFVFNKFMYK